MRAILVGKFPQLKRCGTMSDRIKVDLKDKYRVLMTELLPYELPLWFSNELFYARLKENPNILNEITYNAVIKNYVPLDYKIRRTSGGARILSIMHPKIQVEACDFYDKYKDLVIYYSNRSNKSLRYPVKVVSSFFKKEVFEISNEFRGLEESEKNFSHFISFFKYNKYPFLYKFFESYDYNKLEKRFQSLVQVDVSKCFHNIYTHSISWAIKNKFIAKRDRGVKNSFDKDFDNLMQRSNYSETNGILIGPELSRIFAEIIFQDIDLRIISQLSERGCKVGADYDFRRYVDDYFLYFNDSNIKDTVVEVINSELFHYKMNLNEAKTIASVRPFITNISLCKSEISSIIDRLFDERYIGEKSDNKVSLIRNAGSKANKIISELKAVVKKHNVHYQSICNYMLSVFSRKMAGQLPLPKKLSADEEDRLLPWLLIDIDILFFIHAMDPRIVSSDKLTKILLVYLKLDNTITTDNFTLLQKKIFDSSIEAIRIFNTSSSITYPVETMNIILLLTTIKANFKLEEQFIQDSFKLTNSESNSIGDTTYFLWTSLMLYITDDNCYDDTRNKLNELAKKYFMDNIHGFESTAYFLFWADFLACPYVDPSYKKELVSSKTTIRKDCNIKKFLDKKFPSNKGLIINWNEANWLSKSIDKKVFKYAYE